MSKEWDRKKLKKMMGMICRDVMGRGGGSGAQRLGTHKELKILEFENKTKQKMEKATIFKFDEKTNT